MFKAPEELLPSTMSHKELLSCPRVSHVAAAQAKVSAFDVVVFYFFCRLIITFSPKWSHVFQSNADGSWDPAWSRAPYSCSVLQQGQCALVSRALKIKDYDMLKPLGSLALFCFSRLVQKSHVSSKPTVFDPNGQMWNCSIDLVTWSVLSGCECEVWSFYWTTTVQTSHNCTMLS